MTICIPIREGKIFYFKIFPKQVFKELEIRHVIEMKEFEDLNIFGSKYLS